jgi:hypothetical protein
VQSRGENDIKQERSGPVEGCRVERGNGQRHDGGRRSLDERRERRGEVTGLLMGRATVVDGLLIRATLMAGALATLASTRGRAFPTCAGQRRPDSVREQQNKETRDRSRHGFILCPINACGQTGEAPSGEAPSQPSDSRRSSVSSARRRPRCGRGKQLTGSGTASIDMRSRRRRRIWEFTSVSSCQPAPISEGSVACRETSIEPVFGRHHV